MGDSFGFKLLDDARERSVTYCILPNGSASHAYRIRSDILGTINVTVLAEVDTAYPGECGPEVIINKRYGVLDKFNVVNVFVPYRDVVYKTILVESEGYPAEITKSVMLCTEGMLVNRFDL